MSGVTRATGTVSNPFRVGLLPPVVNGSASEFGNGVPFSAAFTGPVNSTRETFDANGAKLDVSAAGPNVANETTTPTLILKTVVGPFARQSSYSQTANGLQQSTTFGGDTASYALTTTLHTWSLDNGVTFTLWRMGLSTANLINSATNGRIGFEVGGTINTIALRNNVSAGAAPPALADGFIEVVVNGLVRRIPFYV